MKQLLKKIDIIYLLGVILSLIGYYFSKSVFIEGDFFYGLSTLVTGIIIPIFILGGILIIAIEFIITKHYLNVYDYFFKRKENRVLGITILVCALAFILAQYVSTVFTFWLLYAILFVFIIFVLIIKTHISYIFLAPLLLGYFFMDLFVFINVEPHWILGDILVAYLALFVLGTFGLMVYKFFKKQKTTKLFILMFIFVVMSGIHSSMTHDVFEISYIEESDLGNSFFVSFCPEGYEGQIVTSGDEFEIICLEPNKGYIELRENGMIQLLMIYLAIPLLGFIVNKVDTSKKDKSKVKAIDVPECTSTEDIAEKFEFTEVIVDKIKFVTKTPINFRGPFVVYPGNIFIYDADDTLITDAITISKNFWLKNNHGIASPADNIHIDTFKVQPKSYDGKTIDIWGYNLLYKVDTTTWEVIDFRMNR